MYFQTSLARSTPFLIFIFSLLHVEFSVVFFFSSSVVRFSLLLSWLWYMYSSAYYRPKKAYCLLSFSYYYRWRETKRREPNENIVMMLWRQPMRWFFLPSNNRDVTIQTTTFEMYEEVEKNRRWKIPEKCWWKLHGFPVLILYKKQKQKKNIWRETVFFFHLYFNIDSQIGFTFWHFVSSLC